MNEGGKQVGGDAGHIGRARDAAASVPGAHIGSAEVYAKKLGCAPEGGGRHCGGPCVAVAAVLVLGHGSDAVNVYAGERAHAVAADRAANGIPIAADLEADLRAFAAEAGVEINLVAA